MSNSDETTTTTEEEILLGVRERGFLVVHLPFMVERITFTRWQRFRLWIRLWMKRMVASAAKERP